MQILMTADTVGGVWTYSIELARSLEEHGVKVAGCTVHLVDTSLDGGAIVLPEVIDEMAARAAAGDLATRVG